MATKIRDYNKLAADICAAVGKDNIISRTPFTFMPIMIAVTASKHFKCNAFIAMWCCMALCNPDWATIASRIASGETVKFLGLPMAQTTYTSSVLPPASACSSKAKRP